MKSTSAAALTLCLVFLLWAVPCFSQSQLVPLLSLPLSPDAVSPEGESFQLTLHGTGFTTSSVVRWNAITLPTHFVSHDVLQAHVPGALVNSRGTASVTVLNPFGGRSNVTLFTVHDVSDNFDSTRADIPTNLNPQEPTLVDLNHDSKLDLVVAETGTDTIAVAMGHGDGTFATPIRFATDSM